jgi:hypothetical protein
MTKKSALTAIQAEINWCRANTIGPLPVHKVHRTSFIGGLRQAKRLIAAIKKA